MKIRNLIIMYLICGIFSLGVSIGFILLCVWLGTEIVKAVW